MLLSYKITVNDAVVELKHGESIDLQIEEVPLEIKAKMQFYKSRTIHLPAQGNFSIDLYSFLPKYELLALLAMTIIGFLATIFIQGMNDILIYMMQILSYSALGFIIYTTTIGYHKYIKTEVNGF